MATIVAATGAAGNWTGGGAWVGGVAPTAADDAQITSLTTSITIDAGALCRSADFNTFTGTLTQGSTGTLTIGDGTAGTGNNALNMPSGFTYAPNAASTITFLSTSGTLQTITVNSGYSMGKITIGSAGASGVYAITANLTLATAATLNLTKGTLHTDGSADNSNLTHSWGLFNTSNSNARTLTLGNSSITITATGVSYTSSTLTSLTISTNTATFTFSGANATPNFGGADMKGASVVMTGGGNMSMGSGSSIGTFANFTVTGTAVKTDNITLTAGMTVTNQTSFNGNSAIFRLLVLISAIGAQRTITNTGATDTSSNTDFRDIKFSTGINPSANSIGDCGGNSGITFTAADTETWNSSSGGNWSDVTKWTGGSVSRVPLPQDNVSFAVAFSSAQTVTADMPRLGKNISWTGVSHSGTAENWQLSNAPGTYTIYGDLTLTSDLGTINSNTNPIIFESRGTQTITCAGKNLQGSITVQAFGGTVVLGDAFITSATRTLTLNNGTLDAATNNVTITAGLFASVSGVTRAFNGGTATHILSGTGSVWNVSSAGLTLSIASCKISITDTSASSKTFVGAGLSYPEIDITGGGAGIVIFSGANTLAKFPQVTGGTKNLRWTISQTTTITDGTGGFGNGSNVVTIDSTLGGTPATFTTAGGTVSCDFLSLKDNTAAGNVPFYAGANSTLVSGTTNWNATAPPSGGTPVVHLLALLGIGS